MADFEKGVADGLKASAVGGTLAAGAAAIGAAAGATLGPLGPIAAPIGAAVGALIGFFVGLFRGPSKEEREAAAKASAEAASKARTLTGLLAINAQNLADVWNIPVLRTVFVNQLRYQTEQNPGWKPMIEAFINAVKASKFQPPSSDPQLKKFINLITTMAKVDPTMDADPFVYLRPPLSEMFGPALRAAGIDIADPSVLAAMRGHFDMSQASPRRALPGTAIRRKSVGLASGGKIAVDGRAFSKTIAPYGVGSFKLFPAATPTGSDWMRGDDTRGAPLTARWPHGLDADNFAKPPSAGLSTKAKAGIALGGGALIALLFFL